MMNVALFGTSADPPTRGHQAILSWLSQHYHHVAVWAADNPFKSHQAPLKHRAGMLQALIHSINPPQCNLSLHPELSHRRTVVTVERARERWPDARLVLVVGSDLVSQLPRWYRIEAILAQCQLLVVPRPGFPLDEVARDRLRELGGDLAVADLTGLDVSSTDFRKGQDASNLPPAVEDYIRRERLYLWQDAG